MLLYKKKQIKIIIQNLYTRVMLHYNFIFLYEKINYCLSDIALHDIFGQVIVESDIIWSRATALVTLCIYILLS